MGRVGKLEELVGAAIFLASDAASFVTGETLAVDGGFRLKGSRRLKGNMPGANSNIHRVQHRRWALDDAYA